MFSSIPKDRLLWYILGLALLPIVVVLLLVMSQNSRVQSVQGEVDALQQMAAMREQRQANNLAARQHFHEADHFYIDKNLETLNFLEPEVESLQKMIDNPNFSGDEFVKKRLEYLTSDNAMTFSEGVLQSTPFFQETTETLVHPVEVNGADLQKILAKIEGTTVGQNKPSPHRPQLIILDFKLDKKRIAEANEVFQLNLKLLKREFP